MKTTYLMVGLLMCSLFATSFVMAETVTQAVEVEDLEVQYFNGDEITESLENIDEFAQQNQFRKVGFSKISKGHGWLTNGEEGYLFGGFWATQVLASINEGTQNIENPKARAFGGLNIGSLGDFRLFKDFDTSTEDTVSFYVLERKEQVSSIENIESLTIGKLILNKETEFSDFTKWTGSLELTSGDFEGEWDVEVGTHTNIVKPVPGLIEGRKAGFWNKVKFWKNWGSNRQQILCEGENCENLKGMNKEEIQQAMEEKRAQCQEPGSCPEIEAKGKKFQLGKADVEIEQESTE